MNNPLGTYGPLVAAVTSLLVIAAFIVAVFLQHPLGLDASSVTSLRELALLALGAVFGATGAAQGVRAEVNAANARLDHLGAPKASDLPVNGGAAVGHTD